MSPQTSHRDEATILSLPFLLVVAAVVVVPGADFVVTLRNTIVGGARAGSATALGIGAASIVQGTLVSFGVGTIIVRSQPVYTALKWIGLAYLCFLGVQALRSAAKGSYQSVAGREMGSGAGARSFRQGFLTNITNPKMFVFYLSLLPQFVGNDAGIPTWLAHAWALPAIGTVWLLLVVVVGGAFREKLLRPLARRVMDTASGVALIGFGAKLAFQRQ